ncbi:hypothetical protein FISHEDRAFT_60428 [Fistulina hepatica ATCC 64428]|uniref:Uncharacterized protein n=1 Tax=Fistulina hepatica ATCC 64428 TaxID=1128425 RepID=A0A0D7A658_9AGAR|nr:hypothetical protein FISHEDRAFT_60428 [Fistulina hepatica ATCC 64428]
MAASKALTYDLQKILRKASGYFLKLQAFFGQSKYIEREGRLSLNLFDVQLPALSRGFVLPRKLVHALDLVMRDQVDGPQKNERKEHRRSGLGRFKEPMGEKLFQGCWDEVLQSTEYFVTYLMCFVFGRHGERARQRVKSDFDVLKSNRLKSICSKKLVKKGRQKFLPAFNRVIEDTNNWTGSIHHTLSKLADGSHVAVAMWQNTEEYAQITVLWTQNSTSGA